MSQDEAPHRLEDLEKTLYRRDTPPPTLKRTRLGLRQSGSAASDWPTGGNASGPNSSTSNSFLLKFLIFALLFFVVTLGIAGYVIFQGTNQISGRNVDLALKGPVAVKAGDETSLQVVVANRNSIDLQQVKLTLEFPADTMSASSTRENMARTTEDIGTVESGQVINRTIKAVFFGTEGEDKQVVVRMDYKIPGSNALYTKETNLTFSVSAPPVGLNVTLLPEAIAGQEITLTVDVLPKAQAGLGKTLLVVRYPVGFTFTSASIPPTYRENAWLFDELEPGRERSLKIVGTIDGLDEETKTFQVAVGLQDPIGEDTISFVYNEVLVPLKMTRPFVALLATVNGSSSESPTVTGDTLVRVDLNWVNNLPGRVTDGTLTVSLTGEAVNKVRVEAGRGFYRASGDTIVWTKNSEPKLGVIEPGAKDSTTFTFYSLPLISSDGTNQENPTINLKAVFTGTRTSEGFAGEKITTTLEKTIKLRSLVELKAVALYRSGPFDNAGPLPPEVEEPTTYTITWSVLNSSNTLRDAVVKTVLPPYVNWKNVQSPQTAELTFNPISREVVWRLGRVLPEATAKELSFQVELVPSLSQVGSSPALSGPVKLSAFDTFTETVVESESAAVTTELKTDQNYKLPESKIAP
ncbi:MAG: hypothetical protein A2589_03750 [Candidatus Vogelbacteria bacterium RIFOXYD1_FULL_46_19]|uniref:DUF11 domain-containing protein n=1 Tax=Candidatus Vogelbacteria bacterium RIFOXYD1_FULL_46_19 TaxID=1802439 RepID=A0A1G2QI36_9BACT|nr:MAG: hypothetical protein A2589_03750 [Candidatus Vogelbacteria bacterium RIFOXYD1_FULL_46_19]